MRKLFAMILGISLSTYGLCPSVHAIGNIHWGTLEIHPFASAQQAYNDNIYTEAKDLENGDQITTYTTGITLSRPVIPGRSLIFSAKYWADFIQYNRYDKEDRTDHTVKASLDTTLAQYLIVRVVENYQKTADPPNSELTLLEKRLKNTTKSTLGLKSEKINLECTYTYSRDNYDKLQDLDKKDHIITPVLYLNISPKTSLFIEYDSGQIRYDKSTTNLDSDYLQSNIGIKGTIAPKLTGVLKFGQKETDYEDTRENDSKDYTGVTYFGSLMYTMTLRDVVNLYGSRTTIDSTFSTNNYYVANSGGGTLEHQLFQRVYILGGGSYEVNKYPEFSTGGSLTARRHDQIQGAMGGVRIEVKEWLHLQGDYQHKKRESNFDTYDYKNNIYSGKLSVLF